MAASDFYNGQCKLTPFMSLLGRDHGIQFKHNVKLKLENRKCAPADPKKQVTNVQVTNVRCFVNKTQ